jgi:integral membrane protein (TIGR01906 family)
VSLPPTCGSSALWEPEKANRYENQEGTARRAPTGQDVRLMNRISLTRALQTLLIAITPAVLALTAVRLVVAGTWFLDFEYGRSGFPPDPYGFSQEERREYADYSLAYMRDNLDLAYLGERTLPDGFPMFTKRELGHMEDVQNVTQVAFAAHMVMVGFVALAGAYLAWRPERRPALRRAAFGGGVLTLALLMGLVVVGLLSWNLFFDTFHAVFFESGTWRFYRDDTLIRLFPQQFWFDAALTIGAITAVGAAVLVVLGWRARAQSPQMPP